MGWARDEERFGSGRQARSREMQHWASSFQSHLLLQCKTSICQTSNSGMADEACTEAIGGDRRNVGDANSRVPLIPLSLLQQRGGGTMEEKEELEEENTSFQS